MHGVDPVKLNEDVAYCGQHARDVFNNPYAACLKAKGYKLLESYSLWE
jgi:hypothetical protein